MVDTKDAAAATDGGTDGRAPRTTPNPGQVVNEIPSSSRKGFWSLELEWFQANPNVVKKYEGISPTTASYLRTEYGLDAHSRNTRNGKCDLYVKYDPETAQSIKDRPKRTRKPKGEAADKAPKAAATK